jgi:translocation and assembly module TamA
MTVLSPLCAALALLIFSTSVVAEARLQVRVQPANAALKKNVEGYIGSLNDKDFDDLLRFRLTAEAQATKALQALGYYQPRIDSEVATTAPPSLILDIAPGEPVRLREVEVRIEGPAQRLAAFSLPTEVRMQAGDVLNHGRYEAAKRHIQNQASRFGFFDGRFARQLLRIDPQGGVADIELVYISGPRHRMGEVTFSGDTPFDESLLRRMVPFEQGAPYDAESIAELHQALRSSGYFESVRVDADPLAAEGQSVPIAVRLQAREPRSVAFGLGFATDVGPRGRASWTRHWANPQGHSYGAEMELSAPQQNIGMWYDIPGDPPLTDKWRFVGGYQAEDIADTDSRSKLLKVGPEWHTQLDNGWLRILSLKWQHEDYTLGDDTGLSTLLMPGVSYAYLRSDNPIDPNHGYRLQLDLAVAKEGLLSDADVLHGNVSLKGLTTLGSRHRLLGRVQFGGTESNGFNAVPPSLRFFAGGDQSVRGYDYQSLSPENSQGDKIGGQYLFAASVEYQYSFAERWRLAGFYDQGNTFNSLSTPSLKSAVGVGVRWVSPVGPLRLDLAHPLDGEGGVRLHFSMGPEL